MNMLKKLLQPIIREILKEELKSDVLSIDLKKYKMNKFKLGEHTPWDIIANNSSINYILLMYTEIYGNGMTHESVVNVKSVNELYMLCKSDIELNSVTVGIKDIKIFVNYNYAGIDHSLLEYITKYDNYEINALKGAQNQIKEFLEKRPEHLI